MTDTTASAPKFGEYKATETEERFIKEMESAHLVTSAGTVLKLEAARFAEAKVRQANRASELRIEEIRREVNPVHAVESTRRTRIRWFSATLIVVAFFAFMALTH